MKHLQIFLILVFEKRHAFKRSSLYSELFNCYKQLIWVTLPTCLSNYPRTFLKCIRYLTKTMEEKKLILFCLGNMEKSSILKLFLIGSVMLLCFFLILVVKTDCFMALIAWTTSCYEYLTSSN